jgi:hypothetical protein
MASQQSKKPCKNDPTFMYNGREINPLGLGYAPQAENVGTVMMGRDKKRWMVIVKNGQKVWSKVPEMVDGSEPEVEKEEPLIATSDEEAKDDDDAVKPEEVKVEEKPKEEPKVEEKPKKRVVKKKAEEKPKEEVKPEEVKVEEKPKEEEPKVEEKPKKRVVKKKAEEKPKEEVKPEEPKVEEKPKEEESKAEEKPKEEKPKEEEKPKKRVVKKKTEVKVEETKPEEVKVEEKPKKAERKAPKEKANTFDEGHEMVGLDGMMYVVKATKAGVKKWVKAKDVSGDSDTTAEEKPKKADEKPKRPLNAYQQFVKDNMALVKQEHPELSLPECMKIVSERYKAQKAK